MSDALKIAFAECPDLPYLPELPARGVAAQMIGRATAFLAGLAFDLQPAGWRLTDASSREHRSAKSLLRQDLDQLEEQAQGYVGLLKFSVTGPWTLAAMMERPRGDRILADHGARRDLGQSLAEGLASLVGEMHRRLPGIKAVIQLDEPMLPGVLTGGVSTASGFSKHRVVSRVDVSESIGQLRALVADAGAATPIVVHCCAANVPVEVLLDAGIQGISVDLDQTDRATWDAIGGALEKGVWLGAGALPTMGSLTADQVADRVLRPIRRLGLDPVLSSRLVLTPACGLAGLEPAAAVRALRTLRTAAEIVTDQLAD